MCLTWDVVVRHEGLAFVLEAFKVVGSFERKLLEEKDSLADF